MAGLNNMLPPPPEGVCKCFVLNEFKEVNMHKIEILGMGCAKCNKLEDLAKQAADELGLQYEIEKVKDMDRIINYGVMVTPALVVDGVVKSAGKLPSYDDVKKMVGGK